MLRRRRPRSVTCASDSEPEPGSTPDAGAASADAGDLLPFMSECEDNGQCETGLCYSYNAAGPHCTHECDSDLDCEDPSPGCNGSNFFSF